MKTQHTPGPWKVIPDPVNVGKHACHDSRWIATADTQIEFGHDPRSWTLTEGTLICEMRDHIEAPNANARLVAAAPDLLAALGQAAAQFDFTVAALAKGQTVSISSLQNCAAFARAAIAKASK